MGDYLRKREEREERHSAFAVWGAEGEHSRFALPLWRTAYLAKGGRAAVAWQAEGDETLRAMVGLDLRSDPPRTDLDPGLAEPLRDVDEPPALRPLGDHGMAVFLGERDGRRWYLVVTDLEESAESLGGRARDDIYFLAGECAGLLFHRDLHRRADKPPP